MSNLQATGITVMRKSQADSVPNDELRQIKIDDAASTISVDTLAIFREKFYFPNDVIMMAPRKSDRVRSPPSGCISIYEMSLRSGLRFPLTLEFLDILSFCGLCISQFSCRAVTIMMGLIAFFRERGATLTPEYFVKICRLTSDVQGRISCRSKILDCRTRDPLRNWANRFFFIKNDWGLMEKWGKLKELPFSTHIGEGDILKTLNLRTIDDFQYETRFIYRCVDEEYLFKVGISIQPGRSSAQMLKKSEKKNITPPLKSPPKRSQLQGDEPSSSKKQKMNSIMKKSSNSSSKIHIPEEVLYHTCTGLQQVDEMVLQKKAIDDSINTALRDWNSEFVKIKFLQGEYQRRYEAGVAENKNLESELTGCRAELSTMSTSLSIQRQEVDRTRDELIDARADASFVAKNLKTAEAKILTLEAEIKKLQAELSDGSRNGTSVEDFKKSLDFKSIIQECVEKERDHIFDVEVKRLERQCRKEGFIRGFLKGTRLVHRKSGADIEGLSWNQVSDDSDDSDSDDDAVDVLPLDGKSDGEVSI